MNPVSKQQLYYPELDGLRFFAFLTVFIYHAPALYLFRGIIVLNKPIFVLFHKYGWLGVDLFLCLSAFLFTRLLFAEHQASGGINVRNFYIRRALRIWPLYFVFLGVMLAFDFQTLGWNPFLFRRALGMATFTDNIFTAVLGYTIISHSGHLWTISFEEQFYAVVPWLLRAVFKMEHRQRLTLAALVFLVFSLTRAVMIYFNVPHPAIWVLPITHFESVLGGLAVGLMPEDSARKIPGWLLMSLGLAALLGICALPNIQLVGWHLMLSYPLTGLGMSLILFSVIREEQWFARSFLRLKGLAYLGKISYGLYVYHRIAIAAGKTLTLGLGIFPGRLFIYPLAVFGIALCITILVSVASYEWLEKPFLRLKKRFTSIESRPI